MAPHVDKTARNFLLCFALINRWHRSCLRAGSAPLSAESYWRWDIHAPNTGTVSLPILLLMVIIKIQWPGWSFTFMHIRYHALEGKRNNVWKNNCLVGLLQGTDCCLLAYGQTGSGKSYSVFGDANDEGILMRSMKGEVKLLAGLLQYWAVGRFQIQMSWGFHSSQTSSGSLRSMRRQVVNLYTRYLTS